MRASRAVVVAVALVAVMATCSPATDTVLDVVSMRLGEDAVDRRRFGPTVWYPLTVARISDPQADEILVGDVEGLFAIKGDGSTRRLLSGEDVRTAAWTPATDRHPSLVFVIDGSGSELLHVLDCGGPAACLEVDSLPAGSSQSALATADMNEDGIVDVLSWGGGNVGIRVGSTAEGRLHWESPRKFGAAPSWLDRPGPRLAAIDLDDDGHIDVASVVQATGAQIFFGDGTGQSDDAVSLMGGGFEVQVGDLDNDGLSDVLTDEALFINLGDRSFERVDLPPGLGSITTIGRFAPGGQQLMTLTLAETGTAALHTLSPQLEWSTRALDLPSSADAQSSYGPEWVVADLDGDGIDELVAGIDIPPRDGCG